MELNLSLQVLCMKMQVLFDKAADKKVAVIVTALQTDLRTTLAALVRLDQRLCAKLRRVKLIALTLIDQHRQRALVLRQQETRIVLQPLTLILAQISAKSFFTPFTF